MQAQRKLMVAVISLFAFLTSANGGVTNVADDMHWNLTPTSGASAEQTTLTIAACETNCDDDMHW